MSLSRRRYPVSRRLGLLGVLFSALFAHSFLLRHCAGGEAVCLTRSIAGLYRLRGYGEASDEPIRTN
jgi:hypothetical protein